MFPSFHTVSEPWQQVPEVRDSPGPSPSPALVLPKLSSWPWSVVHVPSGPGEEWPPWALRVAWFGLYFTVPCFLHPFLPAAAAFVPWMGAASLWDGATLFSRSTWNPHFPGSPAIPLEAAAQPVLGSPEAGSPASSVTVGGEGRHRGLERVAERVPWAP